MQQTILVIDDDLDSLNLIKLVLQKDDYNVIGTTNPKEGLAMFWDKHPSVLILDLEMPDLHGLDIMREIQPGINKDFSVIILTGYGHDENIKTCYELGAYAFLAKPVHLVELRGLVRNATLWEEYKYDLNLHKTRLEELVQKRTSKLLEEISLREKTEQQLKAANQIKDKILGVLTLDLRSPLSNIVMNLRFMQDNPEYRGTDEFQTQLSDTYVEARNTWQLTENIFQWARCQRGEIVSHPEVYNLHSIIKDTLMFFSQSVAGKNLKVEVKVDDRLDIYADRKILYLIVHNIFSNAVKFSLEGGTITISASGHKGMVELMFMDKGVGISDEIMTRVMDVANPVSTMGTANERGSGLGLMICNELAKIIGAELTILSQPGKGTEVNIKLPLAKTAD